MVVLPFVVDDTSYDLSLSFKNSKKEEKVLKSESKKIETGSIKIGKTKLMLPIEDSYYKNVPKELTARIRQEAAYQRVTSIEITGKNYKDSDFYDVYTIPIPPMVENSSIDYLYGVLVNDLRLKSDNEKTTVLSLDECGIFSYVNQDMVNRIHEMKENSFNKEHFYSMMRENNFGNVLAFVEFFDTLRIEAIEDSIRSFHDLKEMASTFQSSNKKIKSHLLRYIEQSKKNASCFLQLSNVKEKILDEPLFLPMFTHENNNPKVYYKDVL